MKRKLVLLLIFVVATLTGCQNYNIIEKDNNSYPPISPLPRASQVKIDLYFPEARERYLSREVRTVNIENEKIENVVVRELLKGTEVQSLKNLIPHETELLSIATKNNVAYISFTKNLIDESYDEKEEALLLYSIVNSLTALEGIEKVQILIEGERKEIFGKHYSIGEPLAFSQLIVNNNYSSPTEIVEDYYESILKKNYNRLSNIVYYQKQRSVNFSTLKSYYEATYKDLVDYKINKYIINNYDKNTKIVLDITLYYHDQQSNREKEKGIYLIYDKDRFKIQSNLGEIG
ncbi:GerMN domain-containing protein [Brassicibacter mesophilus]|uniref:GerMN domain-containing protein n=1 Tax=Brassicibacter mesophilus TaxID=745119 RepID=UPI003D194540